MTSDKEIIEQMAQNAEQGFRLLMAKYKEPLYWHIRRLVVSHDDAQDVAQETFVRIFRSYDQFGQRAEGASFRAWLFRIATNEALRLLGHRQGTVSLPLDNVPADTLSTRPDEYYDDSDAIAARLQQAVRQLPAKQQLAFNMRYYDEMSYDEIAAVMNTAAVNVKANYHHAKERIVRYMQNNE